MGLGACCTRSIIVQPPDAVVGQHRSIVLDRGQCRVGFGNHCTRKSPSIPCAWNIGAEDNPVRHAMGVAHHQPATKRVPQQCETVPVVLETTLKGDGMQPAPPAFP